MSIEEFDESRFEQSRRRMVEDQLRHRGIADERVLAAMGRVPRHLFVDEPVRWAAYADEPLPIGSGQTISQPYMVARMTELLELESDSRVLEVGSGSGYQAAVLAEIATEVWTVERHPELAERARHLLEDLGYRSVHVVQGDGSMGLPHQSPFDAIVVTAAAPGVPPSLPDQLVVGGRMVIPVGGHLNQRLSLIRRLPDGLQETDVLGCRFVPLIGAQGNPSGESRRVRVLVEGRVQGVWFRESTREEAERRGVRGWVRNLADGRVEAVFEGEPAGVDALVEWVRRGPEHAVVTGVTMSSEPPQGEQGFRVTG